MTRVYLLVVLSAPILTCCWLFMVIVNSFSVVTDEGFPSPRAGGFFTARGWSRFGKILGKNSLFQKALSLQFCFQYIVIYFVNKF